jgi:hypothetical protein
MRKTAMRYTAEEKNAGTRLELANQLFREFYAACFWHMKPDLVVTEELLPLIIKGLQTHGGRRGILAAEKLKKL